jgi:pimeloyl-ACP methyl ester carboxylesterase
VISVLDAVGVARAHFWGYSMGGNIGFGMAKYAPHRVHGLVIGGAHPYARDMAGIRAAIHGAMAAGGGDAIVAVFEADAGPLPEGLKDRLRKADLQAFLAAAPDRPAVDDVLGTMMMPCCLYAGEADPQTRPIRLSPRISPRTIKSLAADCGVRRPGASSARFLSSDQSASSARLIQAAALGRLDGLM